MAGSHSKLYRRDFSVRIVRLAAEREHVRRTDAQEFACYLKAL